MSPTTPPVLIVGAGFAGTAAALRLSEHGIRSVVLEAQDRIGGRVQTVQLPGGYSIDFGASNVHGYQRAENPARRLAEKVGVELHVPKPEGGLVFGTDGKLLSREQVAEIQAEIAKILAEREPEQGEDISLGKRVIEQLQSTSPEAEALARTAEIGAGIPLEHISARYWKTERGFAGVDALPVGGYREIIDKALKKSEAEVKLNTEIEHVEQTESGVKLRTVAGETYEASHVILTVPVAVLQTGRIAFQPALPSARTDLLERVSVGSLDKFSLLYSTVWWPSQVANFVLLPSSSSEISPKSSVTDILESTTIMVANMHALSPQKPPVLLVYLPTKAAGEMEKFSDADATRPIHDYVVSRLAVVAEAEVTAPIEGRMVRWKADRFALGATTSPFAIGKDAKPDDLDELGRALWEGRLGFAGEGTDRHLRGSVVGAVASGEREAERLANLLKGQ